MLATNHIMAKYLVQKYHVKCLKPLVYLHGKQLAYSNILVLLLQFLFIAFLLLLYLFILHFQVSFCGQNSDIMNIHEYANKLI